VTTASEIFEITPGPLAGVRVALIEDHALLAQSLRLSLIAEGADVEAVDLSSVSAVVLGCLQMRPHVALLDLDLGGGVGDGSILVAPLADMGARVVVLTGSTDQVRLGRCVEAGAVGVIAKTEDLDVLVAQVGLAAAGAPLLSAQRRLELIVGCQHERLEHAKRMAPFASLTPREREVLDGLICGAQVDDLSRQLFLSEATVRTHVRGILTKLNVRSQLAAVACARAAGWNLVLE
jgi:DNA-binding NarL/FixJ family response regulator